MDIANKYRSRIVDSQIERYLNIFGALCLEGPKWCGKTWTASMHSRSELLIGNPDGDFQNRRLAEISSSASLEGATPRLIDEWQDVPQLWDAVRSTVDKRAEKGQFILTGSSTPKIKGMMHSGTGRIGTIRMNTMSLYESGDSSGAVSLESICHGEIEPALTGEVGLRDLIYLTVRGGWPGNIGVQEIDADIIPKSYISSVISYDFSRVNSGIYSKSKLEMILKSLARNESTTASNNKILSDITAIDEKQISKETFISYLDILDRLFLIDNQEAFSSNIRSSLRLKTSAKRHFCDPSLAAAILNATPDKLFNDLQTFGFLFESLVERDLRIYAEAINAKLFHYQDYRGQEIDAVIELNDGKWCAFEIKLGANQIEEAAKNLLKIKDDIAKDPKGVPPENLCIICGMSNACYRRPDGVFVVPITALKP